MRGLTCLQLLRRLGVGEATPLKARPSTIDDEEDAAEDGSEQGEGGLCWSGFGEQLDFISSITELVDSLRHIDRAQRTACLRRGMIDFTAPCVPAALLFISLLLLLL